MVVFWHLFLAHLLADFPLHTDYIYRKKITNPFIGLSVHGLVYLIALLVCCFPYLEIEWFSFAGITFNGVETVFLLTLIHMASDYIDVSDNHNLIGINALMFLCWQIIEIAVLFVVAPILPQSTGVSLWLLKFIIILCGLIIVTFILMVLIHLFIKDFTHKNYPSFDERYISMIYRGGLYMALMLPNALGYITAAVWVGCLFFVFDVKKFHFMSAKNIMGTVLAILIALFVRNLIYYVY